MKPLAREAIAERIEQLTPLDAIAEPLQSGVRALVPERSELKDALSGTWLGHPLHPPLTDVVESFAPGSEESVKGANIRVHVTRLLGSTRGRGRRAGRVAGSRSTLIAEARLVPSAA